MPAGKARIALDVVERQRGEEADADAAVVGVGGDWPATRRPARQQVFERLRVTHLLHGEDVRARSASIIAASEASFLS